jgi:hypothetical protein
MSKILDLGILIILLFLELSLLVSDYWWVASIQLLVIAGTVKLTRGSQIGGLSFIFLGTILVDLLMFRNLGLIGLFFLVSVLITSFFSSFVKIIGLPGSSMYSLVIFLVFLMINNTYLYTTNVINTGQIIFVTISSTFILIGVLLLTSVKHKSRNAFKI